MKNTRSLIVKIGVVLALIALAIVMCIIGRGHTVYFDNKTLEINENQSYSAFQKVEVYINGERVAKLSKRDRGMATCMGQHMDFTMLVTREKGGEEEEIAVSLNLPYNLDGIVFNIPGYLASLDGDAGITDALYLSEFVSLATTVEEADEEIVTDEFALGDI